MPFIFDNLTASIIAATVLLIISSIQVRSGRQEVARTAQRLVQNRAQEATSWLEEDLGRIGQNMTSGQSAVGKLEPYHEDPDGDREKWLTKTFSFQRDSIAPGGGPGGDSGGDRWRIETRYRIGADGQISFGGKTAGGNATPVYSLTRERRKKRVGSGGWSSWRQEGRIEPLEYFDVDLLDRNARPTEVMSEVESIRIRFSVVAPFQNDMIDIPASRANVVMAQYRTED